MVWIVLAAPHHPNTWLSAHNQRAHRTTIHSWWRRPPVLRSRKARWRLHPLRPTTRMHLWILIASSSYGRTSLYSRGRRDHSLTIVARRRRILLRAMLSGLTRTHGLSICRRLSEAGLMIDCWQSGISLMFPCVLLCLLVRWPLRIVLLRRPGSHVFDVFL